MSSNPNKPSVCRRIFGDASSVNGPLVDADAAQEDNVQNARMEQMEVERQNAQKRWNFDFENETPLEGDWEWEKVEPAPEVEPGELQRLQEEMGRVQSGEGENHSL